MVASFPTAEPRNLETPGETYVLPLWLPLIARVEQGLPPVCAAHLVREPTCFAAFQQPLHTDLHRTAPTQAASSSSQADAGLGETRSVRTRCPPRPDSPSL